MKYQVVSHLFCLRAQRLHAFSLCLGEIQDFSNFGFQLSSAHKPDYRSAGTSSPSGRKMMADVQGCWQIVERSTRLYRSRCLKVKFTIAKIIRSTNYKNHRRHPIDDSQKSILFKNFRAILQHPKNVRHNVLRNCIELHGKLQMLSAESCKSVSIFIEIYCKISQS